MYWFWHYIVKRISILISYTCAWWLYWARTKWNYFGSKSMYVLYSENLEIVLIMKGCTYRINHTNFMLTSMIMIGQPVFRCCLIFIIKDGFTFDRNIVKLAWTRKYAVRQVYESNRLQAKSLLLFEKLIHLSLWLRDWIQARSVQRVIFWWLIWLCRSL